MCRSDAPTSAFLIVDNSMTETVEMRSELMKSLRIMVGELIHEKPVACDLSKMEKMSDLVLDLDEDGFEKI